MLKRFGALVALVIFTTTASAGGGIGDFFKPKKDPEFLPVDEAFEVQPLVLDDGKVNVAWRVAKGYYLYRQRLSFEVLFPKGGQVGKPVLPEGEKHVDEHFGEVEIYRGEFFTARLPLKGAPPKSIKVKVGYQGCADAGLCYPPQERTLELNP